MAKQNSHAGKVLNIRGFKSIVKMNQKIFLIQIICYRYSIFKNKDFNIC